MKNQASANAKEPKQEDNFKMEFALSTSWNAFRHKNGKEMLFEIANSGYNKVELSFNLSQAMVSDVIKFVKAGTFEVCSIHNYCPFPEDFQRDEALPDSYSISSVDDGERKLALKFSKRSIETAVTLGAKAVVLHCGRVQMEDRTRDLIRLYDSKMIKSTESKNLRQAMIRQRSELSKKFFSKALESIEELNLYAAKNGILLGIETRFYHREIPSFEEIGMILDKFKGSNIFYWHDTGHAQVIENLQFGKHIDFLDAYSGQMLGIHLHDVTGCQDHQAPGAGNLDFKIFKPYLKEGTLKVIEAHYPAKAEQLSKSKDLLTRSFE